MIMKNSKVFGKKILCFSALLLLSACGGGTTSSPSPSAPSGQAGKIAQGPVKGATVYADSLAGGTRMVQDANEIFAITDANGNFQLPAQPTYPHVLVSRGGTDTLTNQPAIQMIAPAGSNNVTPLTTLVALDTTGTVQAKIEALLPAGAKFDADISTVTSPAALLLVKSVETAVQTMTSAISADSGSQVSAVQLASIQTAVISSVVDEIATMTAGSATATLSNPTTLAASMAKAVTTAATDISAAPSNTNITISTDAATAAGASVATAVTVTATAIVGAANLNTEASTTAVSGGEAAIITPAAATTINNAITTASTTIAADAGLTTTITPPAYTPTPVVVVSAPFVTSFAPGNGASIAGGIKPVISATFNEAMLASATDAGSAANPANWVVKAGLTTITLSAITYDTATRTFSTTPAANLPNGATITVTIKSAVKSAAGAGMTNDVSWSFTTAPTGSTGSGGSGGI